MATLTNKTRIKGVATGFRKVRPDRDDPGFAEWLEFVTLTAKSMADAHRASFVEACKNDSWVDVA